MVISLREEREKNSKKDECLVVYQFDAVRSLHLRARIVDGLSEYQHGSYPFYPSVSTHTHIIWRAVYRVYPAIDRRTEVSRSETSALQSNRTYACIYDQSRIPQPRCKCTVQME